MNCTFAVGAMDHEITICKLVTGELVVGKINMSNETIKDVGLIIPREVKDAEDEKNKFSFYTVPYGFPMAQSISGETLGLNNVIKVFPPLGGFEDVVSMYTKILEKEAEQKTKAGDEPNG